MRQDSHEYRAGSARYSSYGLGMTSTSFASVRLITADIATTVAFYENVTQVAAVWSTEQFARSGSRE